MLIDPTEILRAANLALMETLHLDDVLERLLDHLGRLVPYDGANVMLLDGEARLTIRAIRGYDQWAKRDQLTSMTFDAKANPIFRRLLGSGRSILIQDTHADPDWETRLDGLVRNWMGVPLLAGGEVIGLYSVDKAQPAFFTEEHLRLTEALGPHAAVAIQNARLFGQVQGHAVALERQVHERERAQAELRESHQFNAEVISSAGQGIVVYDRDLRYLLWNPFMERLTGYSAQEVLGRRAPELFPHLEEQGVLRLLERALAGERTTSGNVFFTVRGRGRSGWVQGNYAPHRNALGEIAGVIGVISDVSKFKESEDRLGASVSLLNAALESTADGIVAVDHAGKIVTFNGKFTQMWGIPEPVMESRDDERVLALALAKLKDPEGALLRVRELNAKREVESFDLLEFKDGRLFERHSKPQWIGGETVGRVWSFRDVTGPRQLEEQLRQSQKMEAVGRLAGGVAHDFNNLLNVVAGYSDLLMKRLPGESPLRKDVTQIRRATDRAASLVRQLLAFSRRQVLQPRELDLNAVVSEMNDMLRRIIGEDIQLKTELAPNLGHVKADPGQIEQVIMNLALNARDAMPQGGRLTIATSAVPEAELRKSRLLGIEGAHVMIAVSDTGSGMDEQTRTRIFEPFFTTKGPGKGTGLGLSTVYGIVQQTGGAIHVDSTPGAGATFRVYLPRVEKGLPTRDAEGTAESQAPAGGETILLVEDDDMLRPLLREALEVDGYTVLEARHPIDALRLAETDKSIPLLLTDIVMPHMNGRDLAERLTARLPGLKVLYMSGYTDNDALRQDVFEANAAFLAKPFTPEALAAKVRAVLKG